MVPKAKIYMFPMVPTERMGSKNPYVEDLSYSLNEYCSIVNYKNYSRLGVLTGFKYLLRAKYYYFNWIENIPFYKFGIIQFFITYFLFIILMITNKKIIWTIHNKADHSNQSVLHKELIRFLMKNSYLIIIHSSDTMFLINSYKSSAKVLKHFHPMKPLNISTLESFRKKDIDILIWGSMNPYKGILEFLDQEAEHLSAFKVEIAGHFDDTDYLHQVQKFASERIMIRNVFLTNEEIRELHKRSKFVLFPYKTESTLNSGALVDSLRLGNSIIGPNTGAFRDLKELGLIHTFQDYGEIKNIVLENDYQDGYASKAVQFCQDHTWNNFAFKVKVELDKT